MGWTLLPEKTEPAQRPPCPCSRGRTQLGKPRGRAGLCQARYVDGVSTAGTRGLCKAGVGRPEFRPGQPAQKGPPLMALSRGHGHLHARLLGLPPLTVPLSPQTLLAPCPLCLTCDDPSARNTLPYLVWLTPPHCFTSARKGFPPCPHNTEVPAG